MNQSDDIKQLIVQEKIIKHRKIRELLLAVREGDVDNFCDLFCDIHQGQCDDLHLRAMTRLDAPQEIRLAFAGLWLAFGDSIRNYSHDRLLLKFLWKFMPSYSGSPITLYRGESEYNYLNNQVGFSWTSDPSIAESFAKCLGRAPKASVLLRSTVSERDIIFSSVEFGDPKGELEYVVDTTRLSNIDCICKYQ